MSASVLTPFLPYQNPKLSADWLVRAFGFQIDTTSENDDGSINYISLIAGDGRVLVGPTVGTRLDNLLIRPDDVGSISSQTCYLTIDDIESHHRTAEAAGAVTNVGPETDDEGNSFYVCRDPEGHLWSFGSRSYSVIPVRSEYPLILDPNATRVDTRDDVAPPTRAPSKIEMAIIAIALTFIIGATVLSTSFHTNSDMASKLTEQNNQLDALAAQSQQEHQLRLRAEQAAEIAAKHQADAEAVGVELKASLAELQTAVTAAQAEIGKVRSEREMASIELSLTTVKAEQLLEEKQEYLNELTKKYEQTHRQATIANNSATQARLALTQTSQFLARAYGKIIEVDSERETQNKIALQAVEKLREANMLQSALRRKLKMTHDKINIARQERIAFETSRSQFKKEQSKTINRLAFASKEFAELTAQLNNERRLKRFAESKLKRTEIRLASAHDESERLAQRVKLLETELLKSNRTIEKMAAVQRQKPTPIAAASAVAGARKTVVKNSSDIASAVPPLSRETLPPLPHKIKYKTTSQTVTSRKGNTAQRKRIAANTRPRSIAKTLKRNMSQIARHAASTPCVGRVNARAVGHKNAKRKLARHLCGSNTTSLEPIRCLRRVMAGKVKWGGGRRKWSQRYAVQLCSGSQSATSTIDCYRRTFATSGDWKMAVSTCRTG